MSTLRKISAWFIPSLCLFFIASAVFNATRPSTGLDFKDFGTLPIVSNGRVQPIDSLARNALLFIHGKQSVPGEGTPATPSAWFAELSFNPTLADTRKIFSIHHDDVLGLTKLKRSEGHSYSYAQLQPSFLALQPEAKRIAATDSKIWSPYEKALMLLTRNLTQYDQLKHALALPGQGHLESEFSLFITDIRAALAESEKQNRGQKFDQAALDGASSRIKIVLDWATMTEVYTSPSGNTAEGWRKLPDSLTDSVEKGVLHPSALAYSRMGDAYRAHDTIAFNSAVKDYRAWLLKNSPDQLKKSSAEALFNSIEPFYLCMVLYVVAFLCAIVSWLWQGSTLRQAAFRVMLIGLTLHTLGLLTRMLLEDRPPVTNLYSSAIFIGWGAIVLSTALELFHRNAIGTAVASIVGFTTLLIAHHLSLSGDTLEMMRAVLDTNFWLATHVVVITLGYASTFLAGTIAIVYLVRRAFGNVPPATAASLRGMVYGVICFATLASFVGTVLGGIWADQSWGRFWGWDPKENGALLIVIWNAIILHARWGSMVRERGMMVMAVFGNIVTSWSWFGTNMLGIGLHSYGFTESAFFWLSAFMISQVLIMALGLIRPRGSQKVSSLVELSKESISKNSN
jgi:ABC-type transport system involved in cytochrome c biogenesis permease subunit